VIVDGDRMTGTVDSDKGTISFIRISHNPPKAGVVVTELLPKCTVAIIALELEFLRRRWICGSDLIHNNPIPTFRSFNTSICLATFTVL
jgi:hypothetical protein